MFANDGIIEEGSVPSEIQRSIIIAWAQEGLEGPLLVVANHIVNLMDVI